jgi:inner membrane protein
MSAYLAAGAATVVLVTFYSAAALGHWLRSLILGLVLALAYIFLYVVLQSEDYALLIGSGGLFVILATVMILTRSLDWYGLNRDEITDA